MHKRPDFMLPGSFIWSKRGYSYPLPTEPDLLAPEALASRNPWIVVAATLEQAKRGNHAPVRELARFVTLDSPHLLIYAALDLLADAGTDSDLSLLAQLMFHENEDLRERSCWAAMNAGSMSLVPSLLAVWRSGGWHVRGAHETLSMLLSFLLEEEWPLSEQLGPIANGDPDLPDEFEALVNSRLHQLQLQAKSPSAPIWGGKIFGVRSFAEYMLALIPALKNHIQGHSTSAFISLRHKFEASTGIDCSRFFLKEKFQPEEALRLLSNFLDSPQASQYQEGRRYFFGHVIPES